MRLNDFVMRIVAGQARGLKLAVPRGDHVRPTADRVREALFSAIGGDIVGARVLDLFAGTGALGLESLSRGASAAVFVERAAAVLPVLRQNISAVGAAGSTRVLRMDARRALSSLAREGAVFDLVFLDPPYRTDLLHRVLKPLATLGLLAPGASVIAEHPRGEPPHPPEGLRIVTTRSYGTTSLSTLENAGPVGPTDKRKEDS